ncbi:MAG: hypothetical protein K2J20_03470 [Bacilli bacterium]|nr:hypothetical protein [Bacilli bacterium]
MQIVGDKKFCRKTRKALQLLKDRDIESFEIVETFVREIKQHEYSGMDVFESIPTFLVGTATSNSNIFWYASCILHDATHSLLYFNAEMEGKNGREIYQGHDAEMYCLTKQIETLKKIGAPVDIIEYAESLYDNNWYDASLSARRW